MNADLIKNYAAVAVVYAKAGIAVDVPVSCDPHAIHGRAASAAVAPSR